MPTESTERNKAVVRAFVDTWNAKNLDRFEELMANDAQLTVGGSTISCNPAATREIAEHWFTGFPDYHFDLVHLIAEDDLVAALIPFSGTHTGPVLDLAPTGRLVRVSEMSSFGSKTARSSKHGKSGRAAHGNADTSLIADQRSGCGDANRGPGTPPSTSRSLPVTQDEAPDAK